VSTPLALAAESTVDTVLTYDLVLPAWTTWAAIFVSSLLGATFAARRGFDAIGVLGLAIAQGIGGLMLRDVLLQTGTPAVLLDPVYLLGATAAGVAGFLFAGAVSRLERLLVALEALAIGFFGTAGATSALVLSLSWPAALFIGTLTAVGGMVLRDVLAGDAPRVLRPGVFIGTAAIAGTLAFIVLVTTTAASAGVATVVAITVVFLLRMLSIQLGWETRPAIDLTDRVWRLWRRSEP
jgi:uncharacterized membrane protein YeiH